MTVRQFYGGASGPVESYTIATVPTAAEAGSGTVVFVSDAPTADQLAISDGTDWKHVVAGTTNYFGQAPPVPTIVAVGTRAVMGSSGNLTVPLPAGIQANDILVMYVMAHQAATLSVAGWTAVADSPQNANISTQLGVFWKRAGGSESNPTLSNSGGAQAAAGVIAIRGATSSGDPWDVTAGATSGGSSATANLPTDTTTVPSCLVLMATTHEISSDAAQGSSAAAAGLTNVGLTALNYSTSLSSGGGVAVAKGEAVSPGALGAMSITLAAATSNRNMHVMALKP